MPLAVGSFVGPYEVLAPLGAGGMGEVYKARDTRLLRSVALKIVSSPDQGRSERFAREARALSRLSHPHICAIYDVGEHEGSAFLVMEYLEGETLTERIDEGPLPLDMALLYGIQIADALAEAHRQGLIHRDLKPSNVMLTREGAKVLDFGLAKLAQPSNSAEEPQATASVALTEEGVVMGTLPYMSPEQLEGKLVDARTDLFALGAVLYEMLTGRRAFGGDSKARVIAAVLTQDPPPLTLIQPLASRALERVVARCLAKDALDRWQTARDLGSELRWIREGGSLSGLPAPPVERRRRLWQAGIASGALLAGAAALLAARFSGAPPAAPSFTQVTFRRGDLYAARFAPDGQTIVYSAAWEGQPPELVSTRQGSTESRPLGLGPARVASISRAGEMAILLGYGAEPTLARVPMAGGAPRELLERVVDADWLPDGSDLAVVKVVREPEKRRKVIVDFPIGNPVIATDRWLHMVRVSPDARHVALAGSDSDGEALSVVDRSGARTLLSSGWNRISGLDWSPRGDEIWFTAARAQDEASLPALWSVSLSGTERLVTRAAVEYELHDVFADGRVLLAANRPRAALLCRPTGEAKERELGWLNYSYIEDMAADGRTLLFAAGTKGRGPLQSSPSVYLRNIDGSAAVRLGSGHPMGLSPKGDLVLVASVDRKEWFLLPTRAGMPQKLPNAPAMELFAGDWLDERRLVLWARERVQGFRAFVQDLEQKTMRPITPTHMRATMHPVVTSNGHAVLAGTIADQKWWLYPVDGGEPRVVPFLTGADEPLHWSADGRSVYLLHGRGTEIPVDVYRVDVTTGRRDLVRTLSPADPAGVHAIEGVFVSPESQSYCYTYSQTLGTLFVAEGLK